MEGKYSFTTSICRPSKKDLFWHPTQRDQLNDHGRMVFYNASTSTKYGICEPPTGNIRRWHNCLKKEFLPLRRYKVNPPHELYVPHQQMMTFFNRWDNNQMTGKYHSTMIIVSTDREWQLCRPHEMRILFHPTMEIMPWCPKRIESTLCLWKRTSITTTGLYSAGFVLWHQCVNLSPEVDILMS